MAEEVIDPRETAWHPRHSVNLLGHEPARQQVLKAFASGKPHHAWLLTGPRGIGKATLAYGLVRSVLAEGPQAQRNLHWLAVRAHPDFHVLEPSMGEGATAKLKAEIAVADVRRFTDFFSQTSSQGGWRVGLVDCVDALNRESANALLKLVEEPPSKSLLFLINHQPGSVLRTLRSRCIRLPLQQLAAEQVADVLRQLPLDERPEDEAIIRAANLSGGSPGRALELLTSEGAKAFQHFLKSPRLEASDRYQVSNHFSGKAASSRDYAIFMELLLEWVARRAADAPDAPTALPLAQAHALLQHKMAETESYNLDRRVGVLEALSTLRNALKAA